MGIGERFLEMRVRDLRISISLEPFEGGWSDNYDVELRQPESGRFIMMTSGGTHFVLTEGRYGSSLSYIWKVLNLMKKASMSRSVSRFT